MGRRRKRRREGRIQKKREVGGRREKGNTRK